MDFVFGLGRSLTRMVRNAAGRIMGKSSYGENVTAEQPKHTFWDTIEEFGYHFNEEGKLINKDGGGFEFFVKEEDHCYNQQHYDALGELVTEYLYNKMEADLKLHKVYIPVDAEKTEPQGFIFCSPQAMQGQKLMVIINGAGVVRAGQWSRKLIINEGVEVGSQFPYIRRAQDAGFEVVVLNTNQNQQVINGQTLDIRGSETPEDHGVYVWQHIVRQAKAKDIVIVAHSYGGMVTCNMVDQCLEDFKERVFSVVFTDSVHTVVRDQWSLPVKDFLKERAVNFASTYVPLDYIMQASYPDDCLSVSAGTEEHERTSHTCMDSAFRFILSNHASWTTDRTMALHHFMPLPDDPSEVSTNRWSRGKGKEEKEEASNTADTPSTSGAAKRNAAHLEEATPVSKNGERGSEGEKSGAMKDEESLSKNEERSPEGKKTGLDAESETKPEMTNQGENVTADTADKAEVKQEAEQDGKKTGLDAESETKPEMTNQGENVTADTADKAEVKQEAEQDGKKTGLDAGSETKPEMTNQGENVTADTADKAEVKQEAEQDGKKTGLDAGSETKPEMTNQGENVTADTADKAEVKQEAEQDGKKTGLDAESETKPEMTNQGENVTADTADKAEVKQEAEQDGKKTGFDTESETKPEMTNQGENITADNADKAEVKQEARQDPEPAASSPKEAEDPDDQDHKDTRVQQQDTERGDNHAERADNQGHDTKSETKGLDSKAKETSSESKGEREKAT